MKTNDVISLFKNEKYMKAHGENGYLFFHVNRGRIQYVMVRPCTGYYELKYARETFGHENVFIGGVGGYEYWFTADKLICKCSKKEFKEHDNALRGVNTAFWESDVYR